jgi:hypothetical protein
MRNIIDAGTGGESREALFGDATAYCEAGFTHLNRAINGGGRDDAVNAVSGLTLARVHARRAGLVAEYEAGLSAVVDRCDMPGNAPGRDWVAGLMAKVRVCADLLLEPDADLGAAQDAQAEAVAMILSPNFHQYVPGAEG